MSTTGKTESTPATRQIARAAGTVMIATLATKVLGIFSTILIARAFGTTDVNESYVASNRFTEILFNLVAGGALASAFIPVIMSFITGKDSRGTWKLISAVTNIIILVLLVVCILSLILTPLVVHTILAPGFTDPAKIALTVNLLRVQLPTVLLFGISILVMSVLNAHQRFFFSAIAPAMYSLGQILGILLLSPTLGVYGLALGNVIGSALHLGIQLPSLFRLPERKYSATLGFGMPAVGETFKLMAPRLLGVAFVQINFLISTAIASSLPEGSVSSLYLAFTIMLMPQAFIAQAASTAALPTFAAQYALGKENELRSSLAATLRGILLLTIPAMLGLILLRQPLVTVLYQHGEFTPESTQLVAWALLWYSLGLVGHAVVEIASRTFYAIKDTLTPVLVGVGAMGLTIGLSFLFPWIFRMLGWMPHGGLALSLSLATSFEMIALLFILRKRLGGLEGPSIWQSIWQAGVAALVMGLVLSIWQHLLPGASPWLVTLVGIVIGTGVYGMALIALRVREVGQIFSLVKRKLHIH
jgi:putative peptidoglycan lipid II flippase